MAESVYNMTYVELHHVTDFDGHASGLNDWRKSQRDDWAFGYMGGGAENPSLMSD
jgi:hypothetical protein